MSCIATVITSISSPNPALQKINSGCQISGRRFIVVGDSKSPEDFFINGCEYFGLKQQQSSGLRYAGLCPVKHYARKNIGYLLAIRGGAKIIVDIDDDNLPYEDFWTPRIRKQLLPTMGTKGWVNIYKYFTGENIWPRGLPLDMIRRNPPPFESLSDQSHDCPIQQGLADEDPDVDALYRLIEAKPVKFLKNRTIALDEGVWCPFNSQNTTWWDDAFPLMYLPYYCSFRMTDIWRSFVAQRIAWTNGWRVAFHGPTVWQERNKHNLMKDFQDEIPGYLNNEIICQELEKLPLKPGIKNIPENLTKCYTALIDLSVVGTEEMILLEAWLDDFSMLTRDTR
jgi:hypothetical protein